MKVGNMLLEKRSKRWFLYIPPLMLVTVGIMAGLTCGILGTSLHSSDLTIFLVLSFIASAAICGFGYAGLYIAAGSCLAGLAAGLLFMAYIFTRPIQWAGIVGLVSGVQLAFIFFLIGVCIQMLVHLSKKRRETYGRK